MPTLEDVRPQSSWSPNREKTYNDLFRNVCIPILNFNDFKDALWYTTECLDQYKDLPPEIKNLLKDLDSTAGIDWICVKDNLIRTFSVRILCNCTPDWDTGKLNGGNDFTIRETEKPKRINAIEKHGLYPQFTLQAFLEANTNKFISMAYMSTASLFSTFDVDDQDDLLFEEIDYISATQDPFYAIYWTHLLEHQYKIRIYPSELKEEMIKEVNKRIENKKIKDKLMEIPFEVEGIVLNGK